MKNIKAKRGRSTSPKKGRGTIIQTFPNPEVTLPHPGVLLPGWVIVKLALGEGGGRGVVAHTSKLSNQRAFSLLTSYPQPLGKE